ncbi:hypothetical protein [Ruegeria atlantica]|uniref:hypothetical protein n=1 Tax=Ruegeria atlantica TaxID=81569 RepID=UPI002495498D|nr:hypothetical protein [Ruegeria atlantica]
MSCELEKHLVELADKLVEHYHDQMEKGDEHLQDLLEDIPGACEHVGIPKLNHLFPSSSDGGYLLEDPLRRGSRRELNGECFDAIQAYRWFRMVDVYKRTSLWIKANRMRDRFRDRLQECEHENKEA